MTNHKKPTDHDVGYKKPPKSTQYKAGQSGNRKGRPKGSLNISTILDKELKTFITVTERGRKINVQKVAVIAKQLVNKAAAGDHKATALVLTQTRLYEESLMGNSPLTPVVIPQMEQMVMDSIVKRIRESAASVPEADPAGPSDTQLAGEDDSKAGDQS